jgi:hypothetical protein
MSNAMSVKLFSPLLLAAATVVGGGTAAHLYTEVPLAGATLRLRERARAPSPPRRNRYVLPPAIKATRPPARQAHDALNILSNWRVPKAQRSDHRFPARRGSAEPSPTATCHHTELRRT